MRGRAIVVGAGPAGLSGAISLARAGFEVTLLEQRSGWPGRVCGGFLNPEGVRHLGALGALDALIAAGGVRVATSRVTVPGGLDRIVSVTVDETPGLGVPRKVLEETLLELARASGVTIEMGVRVLGVARGAHGWVVDARRGPKGEAHAADLAVLADGRFSLAVPKPSKARRGWFGWNATFGGVPQGPGELSMHFFRLGYFGVLTFADGSSNVCGLTYSGRGAWQTYDVQWHDVLNRQPHLASLMAGATRLSPWQGVGPLPFSPSMRAGPGLILAGDAAAVGDPYMGEGISRALGTGPILSECLACAGWDRVDDEAIRRAYEEKWRARYTTRLRLGTLARRLQGQPVLFHGAVALLIRRPRMLRAVTRAFHPSSPGLEAHSSR